MWLNAVLDDKWLVKKIGVNFPRMKSTKKKKRKKKNEECLEGGREPIDLGKER